MEDQARSENWLGRGDTYEVGVLYRDLGDLTSGSVGLSLAEAKALLAELQQRIVQTQVDEYIVCARVCTDCTKLRRLRDQGTRTLQTLFGTVRVAAPRVRVCSCLKTLGRVGLSFSPLANTARPLHRGA